MVARGEVKVDTVGHFLDVDRLFMRALLENELFEVQEGSLMWYFLPHLHYCAPGIVCIALGAVGTLSVLLHEFDFERLLKYRALKRLLLHRNLELDSPGMWLRPNKTRVYNSALVQTSQFPQT